MKIPFYAMIWLSRTMIFRRESRGPESFSRVNESKGKLNALIVQSNLNWAGTKVMIKLLSSDGCLLNTGICLLWKWIQLCLIQVACLIEVATNNTVYQVQMSWAIWFWKSFLRFLQGHGRQDDLNKFPFFQSVEVLIKFLSNLISGFGC